MTAFHDLPEEIFYVILKLVDNIDLIQCQQVCRSWYLPVHKTFLKTIRLEGANQIDKFIKSIDYNPQHCYLNSIKEIFIGESEHEQPLPVRYRMTREDLKKLFHRFPNLEVVENNGWDQLARYSEFTDDMCKDLLVSCPKLHTFRTTLPYTNYDTLYRLRRIFAEIDVSFLHETDHETNAVSYITGFKRLKALTIYSRHLDTFGKFLPVFEQLPNLTKLVLLDTEEDQENFAEQHLATRTQVERDILLDRLSKVSSLYWSNWSGLCVNGIKFIDKYLTGLTHLEINAVFDNNLISRQHHRLFCNIMMDVFCVISSCNFGIEKIRVNDLSEYLALILQKAYYQTSKKRHLKLVVNSTSQDENTNFVNLEIKRIPSGQRSVALLVNGENGLNNLVSNVFPEALSLGSVDYFRFIPFSGQKINVTDYEKLLACMKSIKHLHIEIPASFTEDELVHCTYDQGYNKHVYSQVEQMTIKAIENVKYDTLLDRFSFALPNIKRLNIYYHCGYWKQHLGEFQLVLHKYSLQHLKIDVTQMKLIMEQHLGEQCITNNDFFVLEIECLDTSERHAFRVIPLNLSYTRIHGNQLQGLARGEDYFRLHISVKSLEHVELYISHSDGFGNYMDRSSPYITRTIRLDE